MAETNEKEKKELVVVSTVTDQGIRVDIPGGYWILFDSNGWSLKDEAKFARPSTSNLQAFALLIERTADWFIPGADWQPIPFNKAKLLQDIKAFQAGDGDDVPELPVQLEKYIASAWWEGLRTARTLPLPKQP